MVFEVVFGVAALVGIGGLAMLAVLSGSFGDRIIDRVRFPIQVSFFGAKMAKPPERITADSVGRMLSVVAGISNRHVDRATVRLALDELRIIWVPASPGGSPGGKARAVADPYERDLPNGEPMWVGGWLEGNTAHVVYLPGDRVEDTQLFHEAGHAILKLNGDVDRAHRNALWEDLHAEARERFAAALA